jgi:iron complex transport system ATP-binding protein
MLVIDSLSAKYGPRTVLQDLSLSVQEGEVLAVLGPNGAGKSTLIRAISGVHPLASGRVLLDGNDLTRLSSMQRARYMAVVPQARELPGGYTVFQTVLMGRTPYLSWLGHHNQHDLERVNSALEKTHTMELAQRKVGELSGGEQQRVLLARALAQDAPILLLDEPTTHLDLQHQSTLLNLVRQLCLESRFSVLMVLHDLNLASLYADRVALVSEGSLAAVGTPAEVLVADILLQVFKVPVHIIPHPDYGSPLVLPDGKANLHAAGARP